MLFFGILLYMSIYRERRFNAYWAVRDDLPLHPISRWMTRDRFRWIYRYFCCWDLDNKPDSIWDRTGEWTRHIMKQT